LSLAEITLILVPITGVACIDINRNRKDHDLPVRMLLIGLPLTVVAGTFFAAWLFPAFSIWQAVLLAALLAPTDAALGQSVIAEKAVPVRIRQAINIESGLNDGMALPAVGFQYTAFIYDFVRRSGSGPGSGWEGDNGRTHLSISNLLALAERQARISFNLKSRNLLKCSYRN
jgi:hypothetical protein